MPISSIAGSTVVAPELASSSRPAQAPIADAQETNVSVPVRPSTIVTLSTDPKFSPSERNADASLSSIPTSAAPTPPETKPAQDKEFLVDEKRFPGLAAYARGEKRITLTTDELNEALRLGIVKEGHDKSSIPLSEAWAPQLFVRAGGAGGKLDLDQFSKQLAIVGVDSARAKSMFKDFDASGDGSLSVDEYYEGIKAGGEKYKDLFQSLIDSYTRNADGSANEQKTNQFLAEGLALATKFWSRRSSR